VDISKYLLLINKYTYVGIYPDVSRYYVGDGVLYSRKTVGLVQLGQYEVVDASCNKYILYMGS